MPAQANPSWTASGIRRRIGYPQPDLRVSDAERSDVADRLGRHYADGRLDQDEFNERVDRAMSAKTQSDLSGLFDDLPMTEAEVKTAGAPDLPPRVHRNHRALFLLLIIAITAIAGQAIIRPYISMLWIGVVGAVVVLALMRGPRCGRGR
jgi:Domain of unknown function (DUF1707)